MPNRTSATPTEMAITCSSTPRSVVDRRSPRIERFHVACSRLSCRRPVTRMCMRLTTPRNLPMTTAVRAMPTRTSRYGPRLGWLELVMRDAIHSHTTGETSHITTDPAAMTSTSSSPARWRCGPTDDLDDGDGPACVLTAASSSETGAGAGRLRLLYPISGALRAGHPAAAPAVEAAGAVLGAGGRRRRAAGRVGARAGHAGHAPRQRGHEDDRQREHDEARRGPQPARDVGLALALQQLVVGDERAREVRAGRDLLGAGDRGVGGHVDRDGHDRAAVLHAQDGLPVAVDRRRRAEAVDALADALEAVDLHAAVLPRR